MDTHPDCLFCNFATKKAKTKIVVENDDVLAFEDINPQAPCHVLIIPKAHIQTADHITPAHAELVGKLFLAAQEVVRHKGVRDDGYRLVMNCGEGAGQSVWHIHLHVLGGRPFGWPPG